MRFLILSSTRDLRICGLMGRALGRGRAGGKSSSSAAVGTRSCDRAGPDGRRFRKDFWSMPEEVQSKVTAGGVTNLLYTFEGVKILIRFIKLVIWLMIYCRATPIAKYRPHNLWKNLSVHS